MRNSVKKLIVLLPVLILLHEGLAIGQTSALPVKDGRSVEIAPEAAGPLFPTLTLGVVQGVDADGKLITRTYASVLHPLTLRGLVERASERKLYEDKLKDCQAGAVDAAKVTLPSGKQIPVVPPQSFADRWALTAAAGSFGFAAGLVVGAVVVWKVR